MRQLFIYFLIFCFLIVFTQGCSKQDSDTEEINTVETEQASEPSETSEPVRQILNQATPVTENPDHEALLASDDPVLAANKRLVYDMWRTLVDARDVEAAKKYLDVNYIQHSPVADTGLAGVLAFFVSLGDPVEIPERMNTPLVAVVAERDLVVLVSVDEQKNPYVKGETYTTTWFDMYRIENNMIVEHWDALKVAPGETKRNYVPAEENPDHKTSLASNDPQLAANKSLAYDAWRTLINAGQIEEVPKFLAGDYIQHSPFIGPGIEGFLAFFNGKEIKSKLVPEKVERFVNIVAEGDLVILATFNILKDARGDDYTQSRFNMWIAKDGLLREHWDEERL